MREKLLDLMKSEGLKPSQLAEILEVNPAGISHILAGRNKPGFDLLQKILKRFPRINPDWLILDTGTMYRDTLNDMTESPIVNKNLFDVQTPMSAQIPAETSGNTVAGTAIGSGFRSAVSTKSGDAEIERIVVFYSDQTFENFHPKK